MNKTKIILFLFVVLNIFSLAQRDTTKNFYLTGELESVIPYYHGLRDGKATFFSKSGIVLKEISYKTGAVEGAVTFFYENGKLKEQFNIENGKRQGAATYYDSTGQLFNSVVFEEGRIKVIRPEDTSSQLANDIKPNATDSTSIADSLNYTGFKHSVSDFFVSPPGFVFNEPQGIDPAYFSEPEVLPVPRSGWTKFFNDIVYPKKAVEDKIQGVVEVRTYINFKGEVIYTEIVKGLEGGCQEIADLALRLTDFTPAKINGRPVNSRVIFKVPFSLEL